MVDDELNEKVIKALEDKKYKWRTPKGIAKQVGVPEEKVLFVIGQNTDKIIQSNVPSVDGSPLFTTRVHFQATSSPFEKIIGAFKGRLR